MYNRERFAEDHGESDDQHEKYIDCSKTIVSIPADLPRLTFNSDGPGYKLRQKEQLLIEAQCLVMEEISRLQVEETKLHQLVLLIRDKKNLPK